MPVKDTGVDVKNSLAVTADNQPAQIRLFQISRAAEAAADFYIQNFFAVMEEHLRPAVVFDFQIFNTAARQRKPPAEIGVHGNRADMMIAAQIYIQSRIGTDIKRANQHSLQIKLAAYRIFFEF